jgi:hypothetical protein
MFLKYSMALSLLTLESVVQVNLRLEILGGGHLTVPATPFPTIRLLCEKTSEIAGNPALASKRHPPQCRGIRACMQVSLLVSTVLSNHAYVGGAVAKVDACVCRRSYESDHGFWMLAQ